MHAGCCWLGNCGPPEGGAAAAAAAAAIAAAAACLYAGVGPHVLGCGGGGVDVWIVEGHHDSGGHLHKHALPDIQVVRGLVSQAPHSKVHILRGGQTGGGRGQLECTRLVCGSSKQAAGDMKQAPIGPCGGGTDSSRSISQQQLRARGLTTSSSKRR